MSNIDPGIVDPGNGKVPPPDSIPPLDDPDNDLVGVEDIREPGSDIPPIEPDPEEQVPRRPDI